MLWIEILITSMFILLSFNMSRWENNWKDNMIVKKPERQCLNAFLFFLSKALKLAKKCWLQVLFSSFTTQMASAIAHNVNGSLTCFIFLQHSFKESASAILSPVMAGTTLTLWFSLRYPCSPLCFLLCLPGKQCSYMHQEKV